ncbi:putative MFS family arabinose efflux permease [Arthrobacter sp. AG1021]|uniref:MFS transporter n=1 Tax=Arthrobacter sp. AG1021 TaxID=2183908 RepID=UPI000EB31801|nr:MFS transporter [Arthrobacter sp. AG1021]RKS16792.1 putative MFS family arabinose efflux permease [Arthrobacter sp. AG1021]
MARRSPAQIPAEPFARPKAPGRGALFGVLATYAVAMCGTTMPTALYPTLQDDFGLSTAAATQLFAIYAVTVLLVLCAFGSLSDALGRKPVMMLGLGASLASGVLYSIADDAPMLFAARVLSGVCAGLVTGTATAYLTDLVGSPSRGAAVSSVANMVGLGSGPVLAAWLIFAVPTVPMIAFTAHAVVSGLCLLVLCFGPESVPSRRLRLYPSLPLVPRFALRNFAIGGLMTLGFVVMGGCTAMTSILVVRSFGISDLRVLGLIGSLIFAATAIGQKLGGALVRRHALAGYAGLVSGAALICLAPLLPGMSAVVIYLAGLTAAGLSHGALFPVGLGIVLQDIPLGQRGSASSAFWVLGYALTAAGALGLGWVGELFGEAQAVSWFGAAVVVSAVLCAALHLRLSVPSRRRGGEPLI